MSWNRNCEAKEDLGQNPPSTRVMIIITLRLIDAIMTSYRDLTPFSDLAIWYAGKLAVDPSQSSVPTPLVVAPSLSERPSPDRIDPPLAFKANCRNRNNTCKDEASFPPCHRRVS